MMPYLSQKLAVGRRTVMAALPLTGSVMKCSRLSRRHSHKGVAVSKAVVIVDPVVCRNVLPEQSRRVTSASMYSDSEQSDSDQSSESENLADIYYEQK